MGERVLGGWGYVFRRADGELLSQGTVITDPIAPENELVEVVNRFDEEAFRWNSATRTMQAFTNQARITQLNLERNLLRQRIIDLGGIPS